MAKVDSPVAIDEQFYQHTSIPVIQFSLVLPLQDTPLRCSSEDGP